MPPFRSDDAPQPAEQADPNGTRVHRHLHVVRRRPRHAFQPGSEDPDVGLGLIIDEPDSVA